MYLYGSYRFCHMKLFLSLCSYTWKNNSISFIIPTYCINICELCSLFHSLPPTKKKLKKKNHLNRCSI